MKKLILVLCTLSVAAFGLGACGGDDDEADEPTEAATTTETAGGGGGGGGTVALTADPDGALAYEETSVSAPAGEVTIEFDNPATLGYDVVVEDQNGNELARTEVISEDNATTSAALEPGEYTYYCSVDGHREAGMEGTLKIE